MAPSHYAALHFSVQDAVRSLPVERRPHVAVVTPGVDATIYGNVERAACPVECSLSNASWPVNWERDDAKGCAASCEIVGFLARLSPEKSPGLLVHAAAIILAQDRLARIVFVGDGAARHMCEELARAYGIENRVIFEGAVYGAENVASYYASFDVVVQPALRAWSETFCIANLEAMASARPIVSFGVGGVGEYFVAAPARDPNVMPGSSGVHAVRTADGRRRGPRDAGSAGRGRARAPRGRGRARRARPPGAARGGGGVLHRGVPGEVRRAVLAAAPRRGLSDLPFVITWNVVPRPPRRRAFSWHFREGALHSWRDPPGVGKTSSNTSRSASSVVHGLGLSLGALAPRPL